jgi:hypothetical protein
MDVDVYELPGPKAPDPRLVIACHGGGVEGSQGALEGHPGVVLSCEAGFAYRKPTVIFCVTGPQKNANYHPLLTEMLPTMRFVDAKVANDINKSSKQGWTTRFNPLTGEMEELDVTTCRVCEEMVSTSGTVSCKCLERAYCSAECLAKDTEHVCSEVETDCPICFGPLCRGAAAAKPCAGEGEGSAPPSQPKHCTECKKQFCTPCIKQMGTDACPMCREPNAWGFKEEH